MFRAELKNNYAAVCERFRRLAAGNNSVKVGVLRGAAVLVEKESFKIPRSMLSDIRKESRARKRRMDTEHLRAQIMDSIRDKNSWKKGVPKTTVRWNRKKAHEPIRVAQYAFWNEFGTRKTPARPFMRNTLKNERFRARWRRVVKDALCAGLSLDDAMSLLGDQMRADMVETISTARAWAQPNAPFTAARKRAKGRVQPEQPLVDEGNLIRSIWYEVESR